MMDPAGQIQITLRPGDPAHSITMTSTRPRLLHRVFRGKPLQETLRTIPLLFNICRRAQAVAAVGAAEQASQVVATDSTQRSRAALLRLEMLHEHLWSLLLDLPPMFGIAARQNEMAATSQQLNARMNRLDQNGCLTQLSTKAPEADSVQIPFEATPLAEIIGLLFDSSNGPGNSLAALRAGNGLAGTMLRRVEALDWKTSWQPHVLPAMDRVAVQALLSADSADRYIQGQHSATPAIETGALTRVYHHPLVEECRDQHGNDLSTRFVALLVETDQLLSNMPAVQIQPQCLTPSLGTGLCHLETARGRLTHAVSLVDNGSQQPVVDDLRVIAPTDWNFHPEGAAAQLLGQLLSAKSPQRRNSASLSRRKHHRPRQCGSEAEFMFHESDRLKDRAELLIKLLNPCVAYDIEMAKPTPVEMACHA